MLRVTALLACGAALALAANPYIHVDTSVFPHQFVDAAGRAVLFHGVSVVYKVCLGMALLRQPLLLPLPPRAFHSGAIRVLYGWLSADVWKVALRSLLQFVLLLTND